MYELKCRDVGFDCGGVVRGETVAAVLRQAAAHAREVHGTEITPELAQRVKGLVREAPQPGDAGRRSG